MARLMFSFGMLTAWAASIAVRSRGLPPGSPPPAFAATVISRMTLVHEEARFESVIAFLRLICFHLLCPAMAELLGASGVVSPARSEGPARDASPKNSRSPGRCQRRVDRPRAAR